MQLLATLCTSMPTVRRTSLIRRVFWCRVKPGGGSVMRHAYASLYAYRQKARSVLSNVLRIMRTSSAPIVTTDAFWPLRTTHHASVLCKLCQRGSLGALRTRCGLRTRLTQWDRKSGLGGPMTDALRTCTTLSTVNGGGEGVTPHVLRTRLMHRSPWVSGGAYVPRTTHTHDGFD